MVFRFNFVFKGLLDSFSVPPGTEATVHKLEAN